MRKKTKNILLGMIVLVGLIIIAKYGGFFAVFSGQEVNIISSSPSFISEDTEKIIYSMDVQTQASRFACGGFVQRGIYEFDASSDSSLNLYYSQDLQFNKDFNAIELKFKGLNFERDECSDITQPINNPSVKLVDESSTCKLVPNGYDSTRTECGRSSENYVGTQFLGQLECPKYQICMTQVGTSGITDVGHCQIPRATLSCQFTGRVELYENGKLAEGNIGLSSLSGLSAMVNIYKEGFEPKIIEQLSAQESFEQADIQQLSGDENSTIEAQEINKIVVTPEESKQSSSSSSTSEESNVQELEKWYKSQTFQIIIGSIFIVLIIIGLFIKFRRK